MHSRYTQAVFQTLDRVVCLFACLIVVGVTPAFAKRTLTLEQCQVVSSGVNERITAEPVNGFTPLPTRCEMVGDSPTLVYTMKSPSTSIDLKALRQHSISYWCNDPRQRQTIRVLQVSYLYQTSKGKPIGRNEVSIDDCPRRRP